MHTLKTLSHPHLQVETTNSLANNSNLEVYTYKYFVLPVQFILYINRMIYVCVYGFGVLVINTKMTDAMVVCCGF